MDITGHDITLWDTFLNIDGGLLELTKTAYNMLVWQYDLLGTPSIAPEKDLPPNTVKVIQNGIPTTINRVDEIKALKLLSAYSALDQNNTATITHMEKRTIRFDKAIKSCYLPRAEVYIAYTTIYLPRLTYSLPTTTITLMECKNIQALLYLRLLARIGFHNSFPQAVALASTDLCGTGIQHIKALQIAMQINYIIKHIRAKSQCLLILRLVPAMMALGFSVADNPFLGGKAFNYITQKFTNSSMIIFGRAVYGTCSAAAVGL
eukprot:1188289-Ditylum_brightwellii.AAC.2